MGGDNGLNEQLFVRQLIATKAQLEALRAQIDALLAALVDEPEPEEAPCSHPKEQRVQVAMGSTEFYCRLCQTLVKGG